MPRYAHLPVAVNAQGEKLSKQTHAPVVDRQQPVSALIAALAFLGQRPPPELKHGSLEELWKWAVGNCRLSSVSRVASAPVPALSER